MADNLPQPADGNAGNTVSNPLKDVSYLERAAILMMTLGEQDAAEILKYMGPKEVQRLGVAMGELQDVSRSQVNAVLSEFVDIVQDKTSLGLGSEDYIRNMLVTALGEDKAKGLIDRILIGGNTSGLDTLKWMDPRAISELIRYEHPQIQSIVISYLESDQAAEVLNLLPDQVRLDVILRIATLDSVQPKALQELNNILEKQFSSANNAPTKGFGGTKCAADIMNFLDTNAESALMEQIRSVDEDLAQEISDMMFVFDNLKEIDDRGIQTLLREVSSETLILALKGADSEMQEKIFSNMSKRAAELLKDDLESKGPVKLSEVEGAQKEILAIARRMADSGEIAIAGKGEEMI